jgi:hypothetical protein
MREDMFKVIVERPRGGAGRAVSSRKRLNRDGDLPTKIGVSRHMGLTHAKSKWLSENLAPLKRFIGKQVGRPWNEVYGEIVSTLKSRDPVQQHVLQHLDGYVARRVIIDPHGSLIDPERGRRGWRGLPWRQPYYVDPRDGVLKESATRWKMLGIDPKPWKWREKTDPNSRVLEKNRELRCIEGIWYELVYVHEKFRPHKEWEFDLLTHTKVRANTRRAVAKRQLSHDELLAHGVANQHN